MREYRSLYQPPQRKYPLAVGALAIAAFVAWISNIFHVMTWAGHRPLRPDPTTGETIPYNDHGILFVTQRDLDTSHLLLALAAALFALAIFCDWLTHGRRK